MFESKDLCYSRLNSEAILRQFGDLMSGKYQVVALQHAVSLNCSSKELKIHGQFEY